jgi:thiamine-phosphate pyrophosphorylase
MIMHATEFRLYLITDSSLFATADAMYEAVELALQGGVTSVQLREKALPIRIYLQRAERMRELTNRYRAKLFINDRIDIAVAVGADGVHLGQASVPAQAAKRVLGTLAVGVSTHSLAEAQRAVAEGADFLTIGPVFHTPSKMQYGEPIGLKIVQDVAASAGVPVFGIGGIKSKEHVSAVMKTGAHGIALISGILASSDVQLSARQYIKYLGECL